MFDPIPLIIWGCVIIYFLYWIISSIKKKVDYEISMSLAISLLFSTLILNAYFVLIFKNITYLLTIIYFTTNIIKERKKEKNKYYQYQFN